MSNIKWFVYDAEGKAPGRCAVQITKMLRGKDQLPYFPNKLGNCGVVIINAAKIKMSGGKAKKKEYFFHPTTQPGHWKKITLGKLLEKSPSKVMMETLKGMLPKNRLRKAALRRVRIYPGAEHPHAANIAGGQND